MTPEELEERLLALPAEDRAKLAEMLIELVVEASLEEGPDDA